MAKTEELPWSRSTTLAKTGDFLRYKFFFNNGFCFDLIGFD